MPSCIFQRVLIGLICNPQLPSFSTHLIVAACGEKWSKTRTFLNKIESNQRIEIVGAVNAFFCVVLLQEGVVVDVNVPKE